MTTVDKIMGGGLTARQSGIAVLLTAGALVLAGLLIIISVTMVPSIQAGREWFNVALRQVAWIGVAGVACWLTARMDYRLLARRSWLMLAATWLALIATLLVGEKVNGARRWLAIGSNQLQASEFTKLIVVLCCAHYASARREVLSSYTRGFLPALLWLGGTVALVAIEPDFGTSMFILGLGLVVLFLGGLRMGHIVPTALFGLPPAILLMASEFAHIQARVRGFLAQDPGDQVGRAITAMGSGGFEGTGLGAGRAHLGFVPEVRNDFVYAALGEQLGLPGTLAIIGLFWVLLWCGVKVALRAADLTGFLIAIGVTLMIALQAVVNMTVVTGLIPPKGISLPFVSYGGSSLLMLGVALGLLMSVARAGVDRPRAAAAQGA